MGGQFDSKPDLKAWLLLIFLSLIWGTSFILIKRGLVVFNAGEVGALRIAMAGVLLSPIAVFNLNQISKKDWLKLLLIGMVGTFIPSFLFAIAQTKLDSGLTGVFTALTPMWVLLLGVVFFEQHMRWRRNIGLLIGLLGSVFLILSGSQGKFQNINYYALFVIASTFLYW